MEASFELQTQFVQNLLAAVRAAGGDEAFVLWCTEKLRYTFDKVSKLEVGSVDVIFKMARFQPNPTQALEDM